MHNEIILMTTVRDEKGKGEHYLSPTIEDAAHGIANTLLGFVLTGGAIHRDTPEKYVIKMYRAQVVENKEDTGAVAAKNAVKMVEIKVEIKGSLFKGVKQFSDTPSDTPSD